MKDMGIADFAVDDGMYENNTVPMQVFGYSWWE
jgi:hypothetical protein